VTSYLVDLVQLIMENDSGSPLLDRSCRLGRPSGMCIASSQCLCWLLWPCNALLRPTCAPNVVDVSVSACVRVPGPAEAVMSDRLAVCRHVVVVVECSARIICCYCSICVNLQNFNAMKILTVQTL